MVLIIDDEELILRSVTKLLHREGYKTVICSGGEEAVAKIKDENIDLIICDVRMPGLSGVETIKKIRDVLKSRGVKPIPEIVITGFVEDEINKEVENLNVAGYLYKPFDIHDFLSVVRSSMGAIK